MGCMGCKYKAPGGISHESLCQSHKGCGTGRDALRCGGGWQGCSWDLGSVAGALCQDMTQPSAPLDEPGKRSLRQCWDAAGPQSTSGGLKAMQVCVHMGKVPRLRDPELLKVLQL